MSENTRPTVMKFGGTSVQDADAFARVAMIVGDQKKLAPVVVTSAMAKVTDALLAAFDIAKKGDAETAIGSLGPHFERHLAVSRELTTPDRQQAFAKELELAKQDLTDLFVRVSRRSISLALLKDAVVSFGEQLSSRLLADVFIANGLNARHMDSRRLIVTDDEFGSATPIWDETEKLLKLDLGPSISVGEIPVMGGFLAGNRNGDTTVLGRGGSDYSAALVGVALAAREIQIWTDVTGVLTTDPRLCPDARTLPLLSYEEAAELAYFGAKVLHPKTIQPAVDHSIPIRVCNSHAPGELGTMIRETSDVTEKLIKSIAYKKNITILRIASARMLGSYGFMSELFKVFDRHRTVIDVISTSEVSLALTIDNTDSLDQVVADLRRLGTVDVETNNAVICIVGEGLRASTGLASRIFSTIEDVNISLISHGASAVNLTFVIREEELADVVTRLHDAFFSEGC